MLREELITKNIHRAGLYFVMSLWIQSQLTDLLILRRHPRIVSRFVRNREKIPYTMRKERAEFWKKDFGHIKRLFEDEFSDILTKVAKIDLAMVYHLRNAIAHSHVSLAKNYLLHRPGNIKKLRQFMNALDVANPGAEAASPKLIKLDFGDDDLFDHNYRAIIRLDEVHLKKIADELGIIHDQIR